MAPHITLVGTLLLLATATPAPHPLTGEEILQAMDRNRNYDHIVFSARMEIHVRDQVRIKTMEVKSRASERKSVVEFTNPEDRGTRYLMLGDNLWIYFPDEDDTVKISGHMLKEGMMGSDVSYEDALDADVLADKYDIQVVGEEEVDGRLCYVVELKAKVRKVPYFSRKIWVDKTWFIAWREEMYGKSGKLLKVARTLKVKEIGGRYIPVRTEVASALKKNSRTIFEMLNVSFDIPVPEDLFTQRFLQR